MMRVAIGFSAQGRRQIRMSGGHVVRSIVQAVPVDDAELAHLLHHHVDDLLTWLDDYPADQVDPTAVGPSGEASTGSSSSLPSGKATDPLR